MLVCGWKKGDKSEKKTRREESDNMKRGGKEDKQGREEGLASQHAVISVFMSAEHSDTRGRSPWHTAIKNAVCVFWQSITTNKRQSENTKQTHTVCGFWVLCCEKDSLGNTNHKKCQSHFDHHRQDDQP